MKFYDREIETETLRRIESTSKECAQMTVITGRRRICKTIVIGEVKRNPRRIDLHGLEQKSQNIVSKRKGWHIGYAALSLDDMGH